MEWYEIFIAGAAAFGLILLFRAALGLAALPVKGEGVRAAIVLAASGDAEGLERAVRGALALGERGGVEVLVVDEGLSPAALGRAERLAGGGAVRIVSWQEVAKTEDERGI